MKCLAWISCGFVLAAAVGCGGKIDNWAEFENYGKTNDAGPSDSEPQDGGFVWDGEVEEPEDDEPKTGASGAGNGGRGGSPAGNAGRGGSSGGGAGSPAAGSGGGGSGGGGSGGGAGASGAGAGGAGGASNPPAAGAGGSAPVAASCDFRGLMMMKCGSSGCHGGPNAGTGLDLTSPMLAMRMGTRKGPSQCSDKLMIDTENPEESALYLKVSGGDCGSRMPLGGMLNAAEQECVLSWIEGL